MSILVGPSIHANLIALNKLQTITTSGETKTSKLSLSLMDDGVLCLYRGSVACTRGLEFRVRIDAITSLEIKKEDESMDLLLINTHADAVSTMLFMPASGIEGDHGYSGGAHNQFGMAVMPEDSQQALNMLQEIITTHGAQWFAKLPELWANKNMTS